MAVAQGGLGQAEGFKIPMRLLAVRQAVAVARKQVSQSWVPPVRERSGKDLLVVLRSATHLTETHKPVAVVVVPVE